MKREERAIAVAMATSIVGTVVKFTVGLSTGSFSMISSAADSLGDLVVSLANLFIVRYGALPADDDHNYGHAKIEALGAMFEGGFIFAAGLFVAYGATRKWILGEPPALSSVGIIVMLPIVLMTILAVIYMRRIAEETGSLVVTSEALHYLTDVWVNLGVLGSLVLVRLTGSRLIDPIVAGIIALFMFRSSALVVREGYDIVMDRSLDPKEVESVISVLRGAPGVVSFHDLRTRRGKPPSVEFHIVVDELTSARQLHDLFVLLRAGIRTALGQKVHVLMHADPEDDASQPDIRLPSSG